MKNLFIATTFLLSSLAIKSNAQNDKQHTLTQMLLAYYDLKDALVNADATTAATKSNELVKAIANIDKKALTEAELKAFSDVQEKLAADAKNIAGSKAIERQRELFSTLSANFSSLAKAVKLTKALVYEQYCPMKKSYWLSNEASIKNPYYGKSMLTCGKVTDTIK